MFQSFWGPRIYEDYDRFLVFIYITFFLVVFSFGYIWGISKRIQGFVQGYHDSKSKTLILVAVCIVLSNLFVILDLVTLVIGRGFSLSFASMGQNYNYFYENVANLQKGFSIDTVILFLSGFPRTVATVLGLYYFSFLSRRCKVLLISFFLSSLFTYGLILGNQKRIGDIAIYAVLISLIKILDLNRKQRKLAILSAFIIVMMFVIMASAMQYQRLSSRGIGLKSINYYMNWRTYFDTDHIIFTLFGERFGLGFSALISGYLSGGYYGLSLCLKMPFVWTFGIGSSYSLMLAAEKLFGISGILERSYLLRMEASTGWHGLAAWNTIFPWLASDFTFIGTVFVLSLIAALYAIVWKEILLYRNPLSVLMFCMLSMGLIFVPGNNQLLHGVDSFASTILVTLIWFLKHKAYNSPLARK